jgi:hypothetical protein
MSASHYLVNIRWGHVTPYKYLHPLYRSKVGHFNIHDSVEQCLYGCCYPAVDDDALDNDDSYQTAD